MRTATLLGAIGLLLALAPPAPAQGQASLEPLPAAEWTPAAAAHLLRRAGFGGTPAEVDGLHALGLDGAVERLLGWQGRPDPRVGGPDITLTTRPGADTMMAASTTEERQRLQREWRRADMQQLTRVREWWMQAMIRTAWPLRERMVLFWHGHFTSSYRDVRNSYHVYVQNTLFRREAAGNFRTLLHDISKDPAMLEYLDNRSNRKQHPNENYAREVMELFTLGAGHYTETDIKEAARALTGWTFVGNRFVFDARQHDDGEKTFLGRTGRFGGDEVLDIILAQPAASRYLAARLFAYFAHPFPDDAVVEGLARTLREHDWELKPVLRQLFRSRAFYSAHAVGTRVKGPVELLVGLYRSLGMDGSGTPGLALMAQALGQGLMDPPNVKGWPGGRDWITTSLLLSRYNVAGALVGLPQDRARALRNGGGRFRGAARRPRRIDPNGEEMEGESGDSSMEDSMTEESDRPAGRGRRGGPGVYDPVAAVRSLGLQSPEAIVDYYAGALLANPPSDEIRDALLDYLNRGGAFRLDGRDARERLHGLLRLLVSTPEFQLS